MLKQCGKLLVAVSLVCASALCLAQDLGKQSTSAAPEQTWTVNFKDSDIQEVIKFVADVTSKTIVIDPRVKGRVKVISNKPLNQRGLLDLFRSVLEVHDFTLIEVGNVVRIVPLKDARSSPLPVVNDSNVRITDRVEKEKGYVTQVIQLKNIAAAKVLPVLRPLVPQHSHLAAYDPSNAIVVSDTADNIARLKEVIYKIDRAALPETEVIQLKYANASDLVETLKKLERADKQTGAQSNKLQMVADKRNNAILLSGEDVQRQRIKNLIYRLDHSQPQSGNVRVVYLEYANAKDVAAVLSKVAQNMAKLAPGDAGKTSSTAATVEADEDTNSLLITATGDLLNSLLAVIERLDIRRAQVLVEAIIVEIEDTDGESMGVEWLFQNSDKGVLGSSISSGNIGGVASGLFSNTSTDSNGNTTASSDSTAARLASGLINITGEALGFAGDIDGEEFLALVTYLENRENANILSTPTLLTMDNNEASISVGQNVPFVTGSFSNTGSGGGGSVTNPFQTIQREDVGITLTVTPHVNEGDKVLMDISQEISSLTGATQQASDVITNQRKVKTQVMAKDGQVIVLGGLIKENVQQSDQRVPILGHIPLLGRLFRSSASQVIKSNLMIFIRPTIVRNDETLYGATAEKYRLIREEQIRQREKGLFGMNSNLIPVLPEMLGSKPGLFKEATEVEQASDDSAEVPTP